MQRKIALLLACGFVVVSAEPADAKVPGFTLQATVVDSTITVELTFEGVDSFPNGFAESDGSVTQGLVGLVRTEDLNDQDRPRPGSRIVSIDFERVSPVGFSGIVESPERGRWSVLAWPNAGQEPMPSLYPAPIHLVLSEPHVASTGGGREMVEMLVAVVAAVVLAMSLLVGRAWMVSR